MLCKAKTKSGDRCTRKAGDNGYCHQHDPRTPEEKKIAAIEIIKQKEKFEEILEVIELTCQATSWFFKVDSIDKLNWRYATIIVEKSVHSGFLYEDVVGQFNITVDDKVSISLNKTSFYGYGLKDLQRAIISELKRLPWLDSQKKQQNLTPGFELVLNLVNRFHVVATQLKRRYSNRETLRINDEYDVQDLLHALLKLHFGDIRPEEYAPSKAGAASRLDFLLKNEKIILEAKMASVSLTDKKIGEQLIIDIERYKAHPDCEKLVCLVYDPDHHIRNPSGLENDLGRKEEKVEVIVVVVPK
jgi:hypothetical protein